MAKNSKVNGTGSSNSCSYYINGSLTGSSYLVEKYFKDFEFNIQVISHNSLRFYTLATKTGSMFWKNILQKYQR
jgi:hypothetical protein